MGAENVQLRRKGTITLPVSLRRKSGLRIGTPDDALAWVRRSLTEPGA